MHISTRRGNFRKAKRNATSAMLAISAAVLLFSLDPGMARADNGIPDEPLSYKGTITKDGLPYDGAAGVIIQIHEWTQQEGMGEVYCETNVATVVVVAGRFEVDLDDACVEAVNLHANPWMTVSLDLFDGNGAQEFGPQRVHAVPYAVRSRWSSNGVPVGGILPWMSFAGQLSLPEGWLRCEGQQVVDPQSPINDLTLPDLRDRFPLGTGNGEGEGVTGGDWRHATDGSNDGSHNHMWARRSGGAWYSWHLNGAEHPLVAWGDGLGDEGSDIYPLAASSTSSNLWDLYTDPDTGEHDHSVNVAPPYVRVVWICRVR